MMNMNADLGIGGDDVGLLQAVRSCESNGGLGVCGLEKEVLQR